MLPDLNRVIEQVSKEKGIDRDIIVKALEEAMLSAAKKTFGHEKNIEAKFNPDVGEVELLEIKTVVDEVVDAGNHPPCRNAVRSSKFAVIPRQRAKSNAA